MKKPCLLIITLLFFVSFHVSKLFAQNDKRNYTLSINQKDIGRLHDTVIFRKRYLVSYIKIKLSNNSTKTLSYVTYSCSWADLFHIDNKAVKVCVQPCQKNVPVVENLEAYNSTAFILPVIFKIKPVNIKFRIGMNLFVDGIPNGQLFPLPVNKLDNVIWSNEVKVL